MNHPSSKSNHQSPTSQLQSDGGAEQHVSNNDANNSDSDPNTPGSLEEKDSSSKGRKEDTATNASPPIKSSEEQEESQTNNVPTVLDTKPINPIFASQDVDDKRTLYNKFNNNTNTYNNDAIDNVTVDSAATRPPTHPDSKFAVDMRTAEHDSIRSIPGAFSIDGINNSSNNSSTTPVGRGTVEQFAVEVFSPPEEQQHAMWEGEGGAVHDYEVEGDVDTLGLGWDEEPNLGGAMPDSVSVAMSAITIPTVTTPMFPEQRAFVHHNSDDDEQPLATTTSLSRTTASPVITATARESSVLTRHSSFDAYPEAVLVDERQAAIEAEPIDEMKQKRDEMKQKRTKMGSLIVFLLALVSIFVGVLVSSNKSNKGSDSSPPPPPDLDCISCIDRNSFTLRAVVHGTSDDYFWQRFATSARQSAQDMRVNLQLELYSPGEFSDKRMSDDIRAAVVDENVDALIVTIPSSKMVANAIRYAADSGM